MNTISTKSIIRVGLLFSVVCVLALGPAELQSSVEADAEKQYLLKVTNTVKASQLIEAVGGDVYETVESLSYVGANLTSDQLSLVSRSALVVRISATSALESFDDASGGFAALEAEAGEELVAGKLWNMRSRGRLR